MADGLASFFFIPVHGQASAELWTIFFAKGSQPDTRVPPCFPNKRFRSLPPAHPPHPLQTPSPNQFVKPPLEPNNTLRIQRTSVQTRGTRPNPNEYASPRRAQNGLRDITIPDGSQLNQLNHLPTPPPLTPCLRMRRRPRPDY